MRHLCCTLLLLLVILSSMAAHRTAADLFSTGDPRLDSLVIQLNRKENLFRKMGVGKFRFDVVVAGTSICTKNNWASHLMSDILPFDWRKQPREFEALINGSYQYPNDLLVTPVSVFSNSRRSRKAIRELNEVIMPLDGMKLMNDRGSDKSFVPPFSNDGLKQYYFYFNESILPDDSLQVVIHFTPKRKNHTLMEGDVWIDTCRIAIMQLSFAGLVDFGMLSDTIYYHKQGAPFIDRSAINIDYKYGKTQGTNHYDCLYRITQFQDLESLKQSPRNYNLSEVYRQYPTRYIDMPEATPNTNEIAKLTQEVADTVQHRERPFIHALERLPRQLVGRTTYNVLGTQVRINGPLSPASIGYDKHNGIVLRERIRLVKEWNDDSRLEIRPEIGYSFGYHQFRYRLETKWTFNASKRSAFTFSAGNKASGFSSKFKEEVDKLLKDNKFKYENDKKNPWKQDMNFSDLGLYFFHHHEIRAEVSHELTNGLMGYLGAFYNYRTPERHGSRSISQEQFDALIDDHYADFNPFIRLEYTPCQYYYFDRGYKRYLTSFWPTFTFEAAQGIYGWFGSTSNYTRMELDVHQNICLGNNRSLSYHIGSGIFFRQKGEYFINYHYFARSQYPGSWEEKIGGSFTLLNDYWYCSSPAYHQTHIMYESPFLLLNKIPIISKYVIKERIYLSHLIADGKNSYQEFGYGMGNNYFNIGVFGSMIGWELWDAGVKFTIEFDQHL